MTVPIGRLVAIPDGDAGTAVTVQAMRQLAQDRASAPAVVRAASTILAKAHRRPFRLGPQLQAYLWQHVRFQLDPVGVEYVRDPLAMLKDIETNGETVGDCDDVAVLGAALALALGMHARFVLCKFDGAASPYLHVFTEVAPPREAGTPYTSLDVTVNAKAQAVKSKSVTHCARVQV